MNFHGLFLLTCVIAASIGTFVDATSEVQHQRRQTRQNGAGTLNQRRNNNAAVVARQNGGGAGGNQQHNNAGATGAGQEGLSFMRVIANLLRDERQPQNFDEVRFNSRIGQTVQALLRMVQNQAKALTHLMNALSPLDVILSDPTWRRRQAATMRQDTANNFNTTMDLILRLVRALMVFVSSSQQMIAMSN